MCNFLFTLFRNKDFISQESPILADGENKVFHWIRIKNIFPEMSRVVNLLEKSQFSLF